MLASLARMVRSLTVQVFAVAGRIETVVSPSSVVSANEPPSAKPPAPAPPTATVTSDCVLVAEMSEAAVAEIVPASETTVSVSRRLIATPAPAAPPLPAGTCSASAPPSATAVPEASALSSTAPVALSDEAPSMLMPTLVCASLTAAEPASPIFFEAAAPMAFATSVTASRAVIAILPPAVDRLVPVNWTSVPPLAPSRCLLTATATPIAALPAVSASPPAAAFR